MKELVEKLIREGVLKTPTIIEAFLVNDRREFVPEEFQVEAYVDAPLPIGRGQTISQPYTVAFMMELLGPEAGNKILDIGFGSGWTTAILAHIVGGEGKIYALEIVPELYKFGKINLQKFGYQNIELENRSGWEGWESSAPFDRIIAGAAAPKIPPVLKKQLKTNGKMVIPVGSQFFCSIKVLKRTGEQDYEEQDYPGFAFVPFVK